MPRTRTCPSCGQMCLLGGFAHHAQQCAKKMSRTEMPCPYCEGLYSQLELAAHMGKCPQNRTRGSPKARVAARRPAASLHGTASTRRGGASAPGADDSFAGRGVKGAAKQAAGVGRMGSSSSSGHAPGASVGMAARQQQQAPPAFASATAGLAPCGHCGRTFAIDRIGKHMSICGTQKQRRTFDSASKRTFNAGAGEVSGGSSTAGRRQQGGGRGRGGDRRRPAAASGAEPTKPALNPKWREEHREFQNAMRAANGKAPLRSAYAPRGGGGGGGGSRGGLGGNSRGGSGGGGGRGGSDEYDERDGGHHSAEPTTSGPSSFIPCPHCSRTFAPLAASRHIPSCATSFARPKAPPGLRGKAGRSSAPKAAAGWNAGKRAGGGSGVRGGGGGGRGAGGGGGAAKSRPPNRGGAFGSGSQRGSQHNPFG